MVSLFNPPFKVYDGIYSSPEDYVEKHKPYMRIYNLGNVPVRQGVEGKLILMEAKYSEDDFEFFPFEWKYYRRIYLFASVNKRIKSVSLLSEYEAIKDGDIGYFYKNVRFIEDGLFITKIDYPEDYRKDRLEKNFWTPDPEYFLFWIDKEGYHIQSNALDFFPD